MRVIGDPQARWRITAPPGVDAVLPPERLADLLSSSDVVVLSARADADTRLLVNREALAHVKRGALLDQHRPRPARRRRGRRRGASRRPARRRRARRVHPGAARPADSPYWDLPNVIVTPHVSGAMEDYWTPLVALFAENLRRFEKGEPLLNVVDKAAGY